MQLFGGEKEKKKNRKLPSDSLAHPVRVKADSKEQRQQANTNRFFFFVSSASEAWLTTFVVCSKAFDSPDGL